MKREIKFRAFDKVHGTMYYNNPIIKGYNVLNPSDDMVVMQYTGLKNKNGKDIYEGDIINVNKNKADKVISFSDGAFFVGDRRLYQTMANFSEIKGNIYETPHLLHSE